jgi:type VI secretion system protein ImpH
VTTPEPGSPLARLAAEPTRFDLDQAAALLVPGAPEQLAFRAVARLAHPGGEVMAADLAARALTLPGFGLIGPGGALPKHWTESVAAERRKRSEALQAFLELLGRRFAAQFLAAGAKTRPARNPELAERALAAAIGLGTPYLAERLSAPLAAVLHHAGHLSNRMRSAERLAALLAEEAAMPVAIVEFAGGWLRIPQGERTRLPGPGTPPGFGRLGYDAMAGAEVFDPQARFVIRLGPLDAAGFARLLPGAALHRRLSELARLHVGPEQDFVFNPVLDARALPSCRLGAGAGAVRLGWTSWLPSSAPRRGDADEARLAPAF